MPDQQNIFLRKRDLENYVCNMAHIEDRIPILRVIFRASEFFNGIRTFQTFAARAPMSGLLNRSTNGDFRRGQKPTGFVLIRSLFVVSSNLDVL